MVCGSRHDTVVTTSRRSRTMVDLLRAYSKRSDILFELVNAVECLQVKDVWTADTGGSVRSEQAPRVWRISDRLTQADIHSLVSSYRAGTTARELAEHFKISKSSVKQILRERGIRRTSPLRNGLTRAPALGCRGTRPGSGGCGRVLLHPTLMPTFGSEPHCLTGSPIAWNVPAPQRGNAGYAMMWSWPSLTTTCTSSLRR